MHRMRPNSPIADGDEQRRPAPRGDECIGLARRDHGDAVRTFDLPQRRAVASTRGVPLVCVSSIKWESTSVSVCERKT